MERKPSQKQNSYKFSQIFGYKGTVDKVLEEDVITCLKFDKEGKTIAVGDRAGRVIIFDCPKGDQKGRGNFQYCTEFQAHEHQFDALRSSEIEESLVDINWLNRQGKYRKLITANSHNIRLWKVYQKVQKKFIKPTTANQWSIPRLQNEKVLTMTTLQRSFPVKHISHIKQISPSNNQQYLLSTDDSQIFLWDIQRAEQPYLVCDMGAGLRVEDGEGINCCQMHPLMDSIFIYGMNKGSLKMADLRVSSRVQGNSVCYRSTSSQNRQRNLLLDAVSSISSVSFTKNGKYLVSRDCLSVKVWDVAIPNKPVTSILIDQSLKSKLGQMVDNQSIYDSFKVKVSNDGGTILTGSYNNSFHLIDVESAANTHYELNYRKTTICRQIDKKGFPLAKMDYGRRILAADFSPVDDTLAVASLNCFFTYSF